MIILFRFILSGVGLAEHDRPYPVDICVTWFFMLKTMTT